MNNRMQSEGEVVVELEECVRNATEDFEMACKATKYYLMGESKDDPCVFCEPYFIRMYVDILKQRSEQVTSHARRYKFKSSSFINVPSVQEQADKLILAGNKLKTAYEYLSYIARL